ncbi:MAG: hypothetical protein ACOY3E_16025 [Pseudomonadota bacterium]
MSIRHNFLWNVSAALLLVLLSGCVAVPTVTPGRSLDAYKADPKNEGVLVLSSVVNTGEVGQLMTVRLQAQDAPLPPGKKASQVLPPEFTLSNQMSAKSRDLSLFFGSLPAGRYKVIELSFGFKYLNLRGGSLLSDIVVDAGKTTDLGMIVLTAANFKVLVGRSHKYTSSKWLIDRYFADEPLLNRSQAGGWIEAIPEDDVAEAYALIYTQGIGSIAETSANEVVAGTRLGKVLARNAEGRWRVLAQTGSYDAVTFVSPYTGHQPGAVLALTDAGEAYKVVNGKAEAVSLGNLPRGRIFFLDSNASGSRWLVGVNHDNKAELFTAASLENGQWTSLFADDVSFSNWSGMRNAWAAKAPNGVVFASSIHPEVRCFDYTTEQWTSLAVPDKRTVVDLKVNPTTGKIGLLTSPGGGFAGIFAKSHIADSCSGAWKTIKTPYSVEVAAPIWLNDDALAVVGGVFGDEGIYVSTDNAKTWNKRGKESVLSDNFYQTANNGLFLVSKGMHGFELVSHSGDGGASWKLELSSFDPNLLKAQENSKDNAPATESAADKDKKSKSP